MGEARLLPRKYRLAIEAAEFHRKSSWAPGYPGVLTYEQAECAWLYGDKAAVTLFDRLVSPAWQAFLGTRDGKAQYAPIAENDMDRWLVVVDNQLAFDLTTGPNHLHPQDCVVFIEADGTERIDRAEGFALPMTNGPIRDRDDRPAPGGPFERWRLTELTTDVFTASAAALDLLLSDPDPAGNLGSTGRPGPRVGVLTPPAPALPSARKLSYDFIRRPEERAVEEQARLDKLRGCGPALQEALELAGELAEMFRRRGRTPLAEWLAKTEGSGCAELRGFASGLRLDEAAVAAAMTEPWSNGPVEGAVKRLKLIKRSMYGRAGWELLRARVRHAG